MHFGHAAIVALDEAHQNLGIDAAGVFVDPPHDAKVVEDQIAIGGNLQIALMHVGVKKPVPQRVAQEHLQHARAQNAAVVPGGVDGFVVGQIDPLGPIHRHHPPRRQAPQDARHRDALVLFGIGREFRGRRGFQPQIQLALHDAVKMRDHIRGAQAARERGEDFHCSGREIERVNIAAEGPLDAGPQHLDRHFALRSDRPRAVDLRDGGGGDGLGEFREQRVNAGTQLDRNLGPGHVGPEGGQLVLQIAQLVRQIFAHDIGAGRKHLAELDIGGSKRRQRPRHRRQGRIAACAQPAERPPQRPRGDAQAGRRTHRVQCHGHGARALERRPGSDQPEDVVRAPQIRPSIRNAAPPRPWSGCGTSPG